MRKSQALFIALALVGELALAPALYAEESSTPQNSHDSMMTPGMGDDGMMNMMRDMSQTGDMMDHCSQMMDGGMDGDSGKPNEQWRKKTPASPDDDN